MSLNNLSKGNNYSIVCDNCTCADTCTAGSFVGPIFPLGPVDFPSASDSTSYTDLTACVHTHGGIACGKKMNAKQIFINSTNNAAYVPAVNSDDLVIAGDNNSGIQINNNSTGLGELGFGNSTGSIQGGITYAHTVGNTTDQLNIIVPGANVRIMSDPTTPHFDVNCLLKTNRIGELTGAANISLINNTAVTGTLSATGNVTGANLSGTNTGNVTLAAVGAVPNANGATLTGQALNLQPADGTNPGVITTGTQTVAGLKTFSTGIQLATSGGTAATLNFYDEATESISLTGAYSISVNVYFARIGKIVLMQFPSVDTTFTATSSIFFNFPARYIPVINGSMIVYVKNNTNSVGLFTYNSGGVGVFYSTTSFADFTNTNSGGPYGFTFTFRIA